MMKLSSGDTLRDGRVAFFKLDVDKFIATLPEPFAKQAADRLPELRSLVGDHVKSSAALEIEYWRQRYESYDKAIDDHRFVIVDNREGDEPAAGIRIQDAIKRLNLGDMNKDAYWVVTNGKPAEGGEYGGYSAIIYVTRRDAPGIFETFDEINRVVEMGKEAIRNRLGTPR